MNVFQINKEDDRPIELTVSNYENETRKREPFYVDVKGSTKHYAICPACKNPIRMVNLYVDKMVDENKKKQSFHAKHHNNDVNDIANYDREAYLNCPFANPSKFGGTEKVRSKSKRNEIVCLIKEYPMVLFNEIRSITGIDFSEKSFNQMIGNFIKSEGFYYKYINKYNLPYGFLNMQKNIRIYNNKIYFSSFKSKLIDAINKSKYFEVKYNTIKPKVEGNFVEIEIYLSNHQINKDEECEYIDIVVIEKLKKEISEIFRTTIPINQYKYINNVDKNRRIKSIVDNIEISDENFDNIKVN